MKSVAVDIVDIQSQRGQALRIPRREVQVLRGLGEAKAPPQTKPEAPLATTASSGLSIPWWAWLLLGAGAVAWFTREKR